MLARESGGGTAPAAADGGAPPENSLEMAFSSFGQPFATWIGSTRSGELGEPDHGL
jgi:hypothetical protein